MKRLKYITICCLLLSIQNFCVAQKSPAKFGKIKVEDLKMEKCSFEEGADAMVLFDYAKTRIDESDGSLYVTRHRRIKIFNSKGYNWANHTIRYRKSESVNSLKGMTHILKDGKVESIKMEKDAIFKNDDDDFYGVTKITLPNVTEGCVIEYTYSIKKTTLFTLHPWEFQTTIPTAFSEYRVSYPSYVKYKIVYPLIIKPTSQDINQRLGMLHWTYKDVPSFKEEKYMTSKVDYTTKVKFQLQSIFPAGGKFRSFLKDWGYIAGQVLDEEYLGTKPKQAAVYSKKAKELCAGILGDEEKAETLYNYVKDSVKWSEISTIRRSQTIPQTFKEATGNTADITLLLMQMLRSVDLDANPVVLSRRSNGKILKAYPLIEYMDYPIVHVKIDAKDVFLDATNPLRQFGLLDEECLNGEGLLVDYVDKTYRWIEVQNTVPTLKSYFGNFTLNEEGELGGTLSVGEKGYDALQTREKLEKLGEEKYFEEYTNEIASQAEMVSYEIKNLENFGETLKKTIQLKANDYVQATGKIIYLSPLLGLNTESNPFKLEKRSYPIDFGYKNKAVIRMMYKIPEGYELDSENLNLGMKTQGGEINYTYTVSQTGSQIVVSSIYDVKKTLISANQYEMLKVFFDKIIAKESTSLVFKKKS
ncbi:MAG: hypothetical protein ACI81T_000076 [Bacteroidia bacterium]|jgi:hypothetical protein